MKITNVFRGYSLIGSDANGKFCTDLPSVGKFLEIVGDPIDYKQRPTLTLKHRPIGDEKRRLKADVVLDQTDELVFWCIGPWETFLAFSWLFHKLKRRKLRCVFKMAIDGTKRLIGLTEFLELREKYVTLNESDLDQAAAFWKCLVDGVAPAPTIEKGISPYADRRNQGLSELSTGGGKHPSRLDYSILNLLSSGPTEQCMIWARAGDELNLLGPYRMEFRVNQLIQSNLISSDEVDRPLAKIHLTKLGRDLLQQGIDVEFRVEPFRIQNTQI